MSRWTHDQWGDFVTIGALFVVFVAMTYYAKKRTRHWDGLGVALTCVTACLALLFGIGLYVTLFGGALWILHLRWVIRAALTGISVYATVAMATDRPTKGDSS